MPMLDVSIALTSPYLVDTFSVQRRQETVGTNGRSIITPLVFNVVSGVVFASGASKLRRGSDDDEQDKTITIITRFALRGTSLDGAAQSYKPDIVTWHGNQFIVDDIKDFTGYGPGFIEAECCLYDTTAQPSTEPQAMIAQSKLQQYPLTQVSSTQFTVPVTTGQFFLYRNGMLLVQNDAHGYTVQGNTLTLAIPLGAGDLLAFYA